MPACATIAHSCANSNEETSDDPSSDVLFLTDFFIGVINNELVTICDDAQPEYLVQKCWYCEQTNEKSGFVIESSIYIVLDNAVEWAAESSDSSVKN